MNPCSYARVKDPRQGIHAATADPHAIYLAGGTTVIDLMKEGVLKPTALIDINELPWKSVEALPEGRVLIGALVRNSDLAHHPLIEPRYPVLSQALLSGASGQLRNMATTGGNLMQRTRCTYFRDTSTPCNKRHPGSGCGAIEGYHRMHAVLGTSPHCIAAHPSDMAVAMVALDAVVHIDGPQGKRQVPLNEFYLLPGSTPERENVLGPAELISAVELPALPWAVHSTYLKVRDRASYEFALVSVAAALDVHAGTIRGVRLALGGVGTRPWRCRAAESWLLGKAASSHTFEQAAEMALANAHPRRDNAFKVTMARRAIVRALETLSL